MNTLRITEIFYSIQGETKTVGLPTVFVRLTGCPLRCQYCDTEYAFKGGDKMTLEDIVARVRQYQARYVTVTGGEPLAQKACLSLLSQLCELGYQVSLETSGALPIHTVDTRVSIVLDIKTPGSGESDKNCIENFACLKTIDQIKFVICNRDDFEWANDMIDQHQLLACCDILFSPSHEELAPAELAEWILQAQLPVRFQLQMHKYLWGDVQGR